MNRISGSPEEAVAYLKKLHAVVRYLDICDGNMQEGSFRCDANISLRPMGSQSFGVRTELKNMNSFRNVQQALEYEVRRQRDILLDGGEVVQETLLWNPDAGRTESMRGKEEAHDYRTFQIRIFPLSASVRSGSTRCVPLCQNSLMPEEAFSSGLRLKRVRYRLSLAPGSWVITLSRLAQGISPKRTANWIGFRTSLGHLLGLERFRPVRWGQQWQSVAW